MTISIPENLEDFGLTTYEAKAFTTMLQLGFTTARDISNKSDVPYGRIYDILGALEAKELIETQDSRPKRYAVKEPRYAVNNLLLRKKKELESLTTRAKVLESQLSSIYTKNPEEGLFWSVAIDNDSVHRHLGKLTEANEELLIYFDIQVNFLADESPASMELLESITSLVERNIPVKILIGGVTDPTQLAPLMTLLVDYPALTKTPIRATPVVTNTFDVIDREKVLLKIANPVKPDEYLAAIYIWQHQFASELRTKYLQMWETATSNLI
jgi:sugar-specific transcriptional regulator TrmB